MLSSSVHQNSAQMDITSIQEPGFQQLARNKAPPFGRMAVVYCEKVPGSVVSTAPTGEVSGAGKGGEIKARLTKKLRIKVVQFGRNKPTRGGRRPNRHSCSKTDARKPRRKNGDMETKAPMRRQDHLRKKGHRVAMTRTIW